MKANILLGSFLCFFFKTAFVQACSVCFGDPNSPLTQSIGWGVWTLIAFIAVVLFLFAVLFINFRKRISQLSVKSFTKNQTSGVL
jgi:hypothetical protein